MLRLFAHSLFSHFVKKKKSVTWFTHKRSLLGFLVCVQLTPLSHVIANYARKVTMLVCCAAPTSSARTHHLYGHSEVINSL